MRLGRWTAAAAALLVTSPFAFHLARGHEAFLGLFEDDFYYYAIVADRLAHTGRLSYDGITTTNGFHPLWFVVLLVLRLVAGGLNRAFYALLAAVFAASMMATYELSRAFARAAGASEPAASAVALAFAVPTYVVVSSGMETALDVPLLLALLLALSRGGPVTPRRAAKLGLLASLAILARLDVALVVPIALVGWLAFARPPWAEVARAAGPFCAAGLSVPIYAAWNMVAFGSPLPVSGLAKQLVKRAGISPSYLFVVLLQTAYGYAAGVILVAGSVALLVLWLRRERTARVPIDLYGGAVALAFAAVFYLVNALTGWCYFGWYAYPLAPALVAGLTFGGRLAAGLVPPELRGRLCTAALAGAAVMALSHASYHAVTRGPLWRVEDNGLLDLSVDVAQVMRGRHGVYGMGAVAGFVTYELGEPVVQLEGLVADRAMVEHIRAEDDLGRVLAAYHVDYLVLSLQRATLEKRDGCYVITQPNAEWSGRRVARMRAALCAEPIAHVPTRLREQWWSIFPRFDTYVFDLRGAVWRPVGPDPGPASSPLPTPSPLQERPYGLYVPASYRPDAPAPLVIALHGLGGRGSHVSRLFGLQALADARGVIYAFPEGTPDAHGTRFWNATDGCCDFAPTNVDDVAYLRTVLDDIEAHYAIDRRRVYLIGESNGGYMAHRAACDMADRIAAIVSVAGANWKDPERCRPSEPVSILEVHSDTDELVFYGGKEFTMDGRSHVIPSAHETVATWAKGDACSGPLGPFGAPVDWDAAVAGAETTRERYSGCPAGIDVELWTVHGGRHIPTRPAVGELAWAFFEAHPKPGRTAESP
jgi:polyhydroxybutyrate depolymerase